MDIDLVVAFNPRNAVSAFASLAKAGCGPNTPINPADFSDAAGRERLIFEKNMIVLQFLRGKSPDVDVFIYEPFDFEKEFGQALVEKVNDATDARFVTVETLLEMKRDAGRDKHLIDTEALASLPAEK